MLHLRHRVAVDVHHPDALVHRLVLLARLNQSFYTAILVLVHHLCVEENLHRVQDVNLVDVLQNLVVLIPDVHPPFLDEVHQLVVEVDVEPLRQLKMDCCLDAVDAEPLRQLKMDCCPDAALSLPLQLLVHLLPHERPLPLHVARPYVNLRESVLP